MFVSEDYIHSRTPFSRADITLAAHTFVPFFLRSWQPNFVDQRTMQVGCGLKAVDNNESRSARLERFDSSEQT